MKIAVRVLVLVVLTALILLHLRSRQEQRQLAAALRDANEETRRLADENAELRARLARNSMAGAKADAADPASELLRLRGEVATLRRQAVQKATPPPGAPLNAVPAAPVRTAFGGELQDFGNATPERAASSLIWAVSTGNSARIAESLELPAGTPETEAPRWFQFFGRQLSNVFSRMEFTAIQDVKPNPDGTIRIHHLYRDNTSGATHSFPFQMRLGDAGWKVVVEGDLPK